GDLAWFSQNMSAGRGYMALAANVFGQWNPVGSLLAALLFALTDAVQMRIQTLPNPWPAELVQMLAYLLTILVLSGAVSPRRPPPLAAIIPRTTAQEHFDHPIDHPRARRPGPAPGRPPPHAGFPCHSPPRGTDQEGAAVRSKFGCRRRQHLRKLAPGPAPPIG